MYLLDTTLCGRVAWILPPKTGTRSVEKHLRDKWNAECVAGRHGVSKERLSEADLVVASVRNPFDVLVSWFHYHPSGRKAKNFTEWINLHVQRPHGGGINYLESSTLPGAELASKFCEYERGLEAEVNRLAWEFGRQNAPFPIGHVGKAENRKPYRDYYDDELRRIVEEKYGDDLIRFNYEF